MRTRTRNRPVVVAPWRNARGGPAETAGATGSLAGFLVALAVGDGVAIATSLAGIIPAAWTWWKAGGGLDGFLEKFKDGDGGSTPGADGAIPAPEMA